MADDDGTLVCLQPKSAVVAYASVVNLLRDVEPFSKYPFGSFATVLVSQIRRKHYVLTYRKGNEIPVGYFGWAMCTEEIAKRWIQDNYVPTHRECMSGDFFVVATFHAKSKEITRFQTRHVRGLYPNATVYGRRDYGGRLKPMRIKNVAPES